MQVWRPFTNSLVSHTFEDYKRRYDKILTGSSNSPPNKDSVDKKAFLPFKITEKDTEERLRSFRELKEKVNKQRVMIKKRDYSFQNRNRAKEKVRKNELTEIKEEKLRRIRDVREINDRKFGKQDRYKSEGVIKGETFEMTQIFNQDYVKMPLIGKKLKSSLYIE